MARKKQKTFLDQLNAAGMTDELVAARIAEIMNTGDPRYKMDAAKLYLTLKGEIKSEKGTAIFTSGPTMMIVGATKERIRSLREGPVLDVPELPDSEKPN